MAGELRKVGDVFPFTYGKNLPSDRRNGQGAVPVYGSNGVVGYHDEPLTGGPTVIVGRKGTIGSIHLSHVPCWTIDTTYHIEFADVLSARFCAYALSTLRLDDMNSDSGVPGLNRDAAHDRLIRFPDRPERDKIAEVLGALDDKIELNRQMAVTLEDMAGALFKSWFVDFGAVHAKVAGHDLGLPAEIAELFPEEFDEEGLPKGWHKRQFSQLVLQDRETVDPVIFGDAVVEHFSLPAFDAGQQPALESASSIKSIKLKVSPPVALFSKLNPATPRVWAIETGSVKPQIASTEFLAFRPKDHTVPFSFIVELLMSREFRDRASSMVTGTSKSHQRVQPAALLETEWALPTETLLSAFDFVAAPILKRRELLRDEAASLIALRDSILPKLLTGSLPVTETETAIAAA